MRCAGFESGDVVEFGKVPRDSGLSDIFTTDAEFITYNLA